MTNIIKLKRRTSGTTGSPASLSSGEPAFNETTADLNLYYGAGDNGSGQATSIMVIGGFGSVFNQKVTAFRLDQFAAATAPLSGVDPTQPYHLSTKNYVDNAIQGQSPKNAVQYATYGAALPAYSASGGVLTATANGALVVDGATPAAGQSVLVKDEPVQANNGIYTVTNPGSSSTAFVLTRRNDANTWAEIPGASVFVEAGANNAETGWVSSSPINGTINTTSITFVQFSAAGTTQAGNGLTKSGQTLSVLADTGISVSATGVRISATYAGQTSITTLGTIGTGTWQGSTVALNYGGTGANLTALADGSILKKVGTAVVAASPGTDYLSSTSTVDGGTF
jgi:hypothetical protein